MRPNRHAFLSIPYNQSIWQHDKAGFFHIRLTQGREWMPFYGIMKRIA
ncbi:hypothetical protein HMPREF1985_01094 [Mitsuokella sp. oral taxon 131 str. W9106]|nr:hypothetical protein HMPREF1985_01094 [Mitsuokella sp. oral taxon 131 str. W9106]